MKTNTTIFFAIKLSKIKRLATVTVISISTLGGLLIATLTPAQAVIVGKDDRVTPNYAWLTRPGQQRAAFGQLEIMQQDGRFKKCTFTMLWRNIAVTNAHCVLDPQGRPVSQIKAFAARHGIIPGTNTPRYKAMTSVTQFASGLGNKYPSTAADFANDWAIIRLKDPIGDTVGWLNLVPIDQNAKTIAGKVTNYIGYPADWPAATPAMHAGAQFLNLDSSGLMLHNADTTPGTSGSGMYRFIADSNLQVQAVNNSQGWQLTNGQIVNGAATVDKFRSTFEFYRRAWNP
jgi:V8-like Glu-specific endopeptidase